MHSMMERGILSVLSELNKKKMLVICIVCSIIFSGCVLDNQSTENTQAANNKVWVATIKDNLGLIEGAQARNFVCKNNKGIYLSDRHQIYEYTESGLRQIKDLGERWILNIMCTDNYLIYLDNQYDTTRLDLKTGETVLLFEKTDVNYMSANERDYFISLYTPNDEKLECSKTYLFQGDSLDKIELTQYLRPVDGTDLYEYGTYEDYELYGLYATKMDKKWKFISLIQNEDWQTCNMDGASCCLDGSYLFFLYEEDDNVKWYYNNQEMEIKIVKELSEYSYGLYAGLSAIYDNRLYILVQYSSGKYAGNPNPSYSKCDAIICISPIDGGESVVYQTTGGDERIVGFDIESDVVYIYNDKYAEVWKMNLTTGEYEVIKDNLPDNTTLHFEWYGDKLFIFEEAGPVFVDAVN